MTSQFILNLVEKVIKNRVAYIFESSQVEVAFETPALDESFT